MTTTEIIQAIRNEIERLMDEYKPIVGGVDETTGAHIVLAKLLSFLSTLESEKPINQDLEKELARFYLKDLCGSEKDEIPEATLHHNFPIMWDDLRDIARHFAKWGAEHSGSSEIPNDLEQRWYELQTNFREINEAFEEGKKEQKEQMMKGAVNGEVSRCATVHYVKINESELFARLKQFQKGDKVRIIICKKED